MSCSEEGCITCGDVGVPMRVIETREDGQASCADGDAVRHLIATDLVAPVSPGDELIVHAGVAIGRL